MPCFCFIKDINECKLDPCVHGNCTDLINDYSFSCDPGYYGKNCNESTLSGKF